MNVKSVSRIPHQTSINDQPKQLFIIKFNFDKIVEAKLRKGQAG